MPKPADAFLWTKCTFDSIILFLGGNPPETHFYVFMQIGVWYYSKRKDHTESMDWFKLDG